MRRLNCPVNELDHSASTEQCNRKQQSLVTTTGCEHCLIEQMTYGVLVSNSVMLIAKLRCGWDTYGKISGDEAFVEQTDSAGQSMPPPLVVLVPFNRRIAIQFDLDESLLLPVKMKDLDWIARRPRDSSLNVGKAERELGMELFGVGRGLEQMARSE